VLTLSFLLPTCGRRTLVDVLADLKKKIGIDDEVLVVSDGPDTLVKKLVEKLEDGRFRYFATAETTHRWGNPQRDLGVQEATKDFVACIDDDDLFAENGIEDIRKCCEMAPDRPHIFVVSQMFGTLCGWDWELSRLPVGNGCFVFPNIKEKIGKWNVDDGGDGRGTDVLFTKKTSSFYDVPPMAHNVITYMERAAGEY
jgi:hypothetical protein